MSDHITFMRQAIIQAEQGIAQGQAPFGACLARNDNLLVSAYNEAHARHDVTAHAEVCVLRAACQQLQTHDLSGGTIYTTCEPCPMCFSACHFANIETVVFACRIEDALRAGIPQLEIAAHTMQTHGRSPVRLIGDVLRAEALTLFATWQKFTGK